MEAVLNVACKEVGSAWSERVERKRRVDLLQLVVSEEELQIAGCHGATHLDRLDGVDTHDMRGRHAGRCSG